nr:MAG TPA: hypothetical protein [Caudoviricetes sp.]
MLSLNFFTIFLITIYSLYFLTYDIYIISLYVFVGKLQIIPR